MCFGKSKSSTPAATPAPAAPTQFEYVSPDVSNSQQRKAAINSSTGSATEASSFGAELGAASAAQPSATGAV